MKKLLCTALALLALLPLLALAEGDALFPARDDATGKMGYIDRTGQWVIPPRFDGAGDFRGDYAQVAVYPPDAESAKDREDCDGIIDRTGAFVLPPEYHLDSGQSGDYFGGRDTGIWLVRRYGDILYGEDETGRRTVLSWGKTGFFDIPSGCFSGLKWRSVWHWASDSRLIPVTDDEGWAGYADRSTGELAIPCQYYSIDPASFCEGVAVVAYMDQEYMPSDFFMIDEAGARIPLPENLKVDYGFDASEGLLMVQDRDTELYGFVDLQGRPVIPPQYLRANDFADGYAAVLLSPGNWGYIDREGRLVHAGIPYDGDWWGPECRNGVYVLKTGDAEWSAYRVTGEKLFTLRDIDGLDAPMDNGLYRFWRKDCCGLADRTGRVVSDAQWQFKWFEPMDFPEGLQLVGQNGKWGYLDESGQLALPMIYDDAESFHNGLAWVRIGNRCGYIDREGNEVFFWRADEH